MIITEIQYFFSKIIRFQAIFKDTVEFTCALEFKISSQPKKANFSAFFLLYLNNHTTVGFYTSTCTVLLLMLKALAVCRTVALWSMI